MNINTNRLKIRVFKESDLEDLFEIYSNEDTFRYLLHEPWTLSTKGEASYKKLSAKKLTVNTPISLACQLEDKVIGDISIWYTEMKETVEIGFAFHHAYSGKGYAAEAVRGVIEHLFTVEKVHRIQANLDCRNLPSAGLCERVGMRQEALFIEDYWSKNEWTDSFVYGMLLSDFKSDD